MAPQYRDTWQEYPNMAEMARGRVANPGPNLGGTQCPASEFTFAVSEDGGENWHNPRPEEKEALNPDCLGLMDAPRLVASVARKRAPLCRRRAGSLSLKGQRSSGLPGRDQQATGERDAPAASGPAWGGGLLRLRIQRNGVSNLFMLFAPLEGWRRVEVTDRRTKADWARVVKQLVDEDYPPRTIVLVMDNLNTHHPASLYEAFEDIATEHGHPPQFVFDQSALTATAQAQTSRIKLKSLYPSIQHWDRGHSVPRIRVHLRGLRGRRRELAQPPPRGEGSPQPGHNRHRPVLPEDPRRLLPPQMDPADTQSTTPRLSITESPNPRGIL